MRHLKKLTKFDYANHKSYHMVLAVRKIAVFCLGVLLFFTNTSFVKKHDLPLSIIVEDAKGKLKNTEITITANSEFVHKLSSKNSKHEINLKVGAIYDIAVIKKGYITKKLVNFDTRVPEGRENEPFRNFQMIFFLTPSISNSDSTIIIKFPFKFSNKIDDFDTPHGGCIAPSY